MMMSIPLETTGDYSAPPLCLTVPEHFAGQRLDQALAALLPQHSRNRLQGWIKDGRVYVDGDVADEPKQKVHGGESLEINPEEDQRTLADQPEDIPLAVVFEDDQLLVIDKPAGLVVHPAAGNWTGTLLNGLLHHCPSLAGIPRAGIVHRLDKDTSGLLVVAKTLEAQTDLVRQLQARTVKRLYLALARGNVAHDGVVDAPVGRHPTQRVKMAVTNAGKPARTHYRVLERFADCTLVECSLETGRTHQIRVHLASLGHPLVGDAVYGGNRPGGPVFGRQALHARRLGLLHPSSALPMEWESPLPADFTELLEHLRAR
jgi:23S rRNA pseudouridine1911/1915/1917 synthase